MGDVNCLRCKYRHTDNGNCTAVGGFCTAVPAAHCPLLREYLDTGLTSEEITKIGMETEAGCVRAIARMYGVDTKRLRELAAADREGRVTVEAPAGGGKWRCMELPPLWDTERPMPFMPSEFELKAQKSADEIEAQAREFSTNISETLETQVAVEAESEEAALREVERRWKNGEYILDADNFQELTSGRQTIRPSNTLTRGKKSTGSSCS